MKLCVLVMNGFKHGAWGTKHGANLALFSAINLSSANDNVYLSNSLVRQIDHNAKHLVEGFTIALRLNYKNLHNADFFRAPCSMPFAPCDLANHSFYKIN